MNDKLASRIKRLEVMAVAQDKRDRAAAPPWRSSGDPEAENFLCGAVLYELARIAAPRGHCPSRIEPPPGVLDAAMARVWALDDLIVNEGIEAARRAYERERPAIDPLDQP